MALIQPLNKPLPLSGGLMDLRKPRPTNPPPNGPPRNGGAGQGGTDRSLVAQNIPVTQRNPLGQYYGGQLQQPANQTPPQNPNVPFAPMPNQPNPLGPPNPNLGPGGKSFSGGLMSAPTADPFNSSTTAQSSIATPTANASNSSTAAPKTASTWQTSAQQARGNPGALADLARRMQMDPNSVSFADVQAYQQAYYGSGPMINNQGLLTPQQLQAILVRANPNITQGETDWMNNQAGQPPPTGGVQGSNPPIDFGPYGPNGPNPPPNTGGTTPPGSTNPGGTNPGGTNPGGPSGPGINYPPYTPGLPNTGGPPTGATPPGGNPPGTGTGLPPTTQPPGAGNPPGTSGPTSGPGRDPTTNNPNNPNPNWTSDPWNTRSTNWQAPPGYSVDAGMLPGLTGNLGNYDNYNDLITGWLSQLGSSYQDQFGNGIGGNSINPDGSWNLPPELQSLVERYGSANTDPRMRDVTADQTVEGRLGGLMRQNNELNQIAVENANAESAARGMLGSGVAAGAALRASREAMLPIAQQDASSSAQASRDNQSAFNQDALADQQNRTGLMGQEYGTRAQLLDSATDRRWRSAEALTERAYRTMENELGFRRGALDREDVQSFQNQQQQMQNSFSRSMQEMQNNWQGDQNELNRQQERIGAYYNQMFGREGTFSNILASIYNNPNLTPEQQQQAATNMQAIMRAFYESFNRTFAQGIPEIFTDPYQSGGTETGDTTPDPGGNP